MMFFDEFEHSVGLGGVLGAIKVSKRRYDAVVHFPKFWSTSVDLLVNISTISYTNSPKNNKNDRFFVKI